MKERTATTFNLLADGSYFSFKDKDEAPELKPEELLVFQKLGEFTIRKLGGKTSQVWYNNSDIYFEGRDITNMPSPLKHEVETYNNIED